MTNVGLFDASLFTRKVVGDYAVYDQSLLFRAGTFPGRIVQGKPLTVTPDHLARIVASFSPSNVKGNIQHSEFLKGRACHVLSVYQDGNELKGTVAVPLWLDENLDDAHRKVSVELDPHTFDSLVGICLCTNPAITDAQLMTAYTDFTAAKAKHTTMHGQSSMQHLHDQSARAGALCKEPDADDKGKMTSKHEAKHFQAVHDMTLQGGASCANMGMGYYTECATEADMPRADPTLPVQAVDNFQTANPPTDTNKEPVMLKKSDILASFMALFSGAPVENDLATITDPSGVVHTLEPAQFDVTKSAEFQAKEAEAADLAAKLAEFQAREDAQFTAANETAVDALIAVGKYDPKDRDQMLIDRKSNPVLFDKMAVLVPVPAEFQTNSTPTIPAEQAAAAVDRKHSDVSLTNTANYLSNSGISPRL